MAEPQDEVVIPTPPPANGPPSLGKFRDVIVEFCKKEDGPTEVEYAVMLALIIVVCLAAITTLGDNKLSPLKLDPAPEPVPEPAAPPTE